MDAIRRAADVMMAGKVTVVAGYGDVGHFDKVIDVAFLIREIGYTKTEIQPEYYPTKCLFGATFALQIIPKQALMT